MDRNRLNFLLHSFTEGRLDRKDYDELIDLIHQQEAEGLILDGMQDILNKLKTRPTREEQANSEALYHRMMQDPRMLGTGDGLRLNVGVRRIAWWAAAATVILTVGTILAVHHTRPRATAMLDVHTIPGERRRVVLPDSSVVWLNAESRLSYTMGPQRTVTLEGEAFFQVKEDPTHPFVVNTGRIHTTVLGTAFDVNTYDASSYTVTVTQGKVSVDGTKPIARLTMNRQLEVNPVTGESAVSDVDGAGLSAWRNGELLFDNVSMGAAAVVIERWFGIQIQFKDTSIRNDRFSVSFLKGEDIGQVMDIISTLNNFTYTREGKTILIGK